MMGTWLLLGLLSLLAFPQRAASEEREKNLPEPYRKWLEEEVPYIISKVERETFLSLKTENERQSFLEAFWRKRDPNPSTLENEYKIEHYKRLAYANEFFGRDTFRPGWQTDRGRYYILLGKPNTRRPLETSDEIYPSEVWFYNDPQLKYVGLPPFFHLLFFRRQGSGEFKLYSPLSDGPQALLTGFQAPLRNFGDNVQRAYDKLSTIDSELAEASLSFRTDEGDAARFQKPSFGTLALLNDVANVPFYRLDTSYAKQLDFERGNIESDYLFTYVPSFGAVHILPGPESAYYLHWLVELDAENVGFVRDQDQGNYSSVFIASLEIAPLGDENRIVIDQRKEMFMTLSEGQAKSSLHLPFACSGMTPLIPGAYRARVILRNRACPSREESGCLKSYTLFESNVNVPEWQQDRAELSELVLAYGTEVIPGEAQYRPYRFGNVEVLPNPRAVYAISDKVFVAAEPRNARPGSRLRFQVVGEEPSARAQGERSESRSERGGSREPVGDGGGAPSQRGNVAPRTDREPAGKTWVEKIVEVNGPTSGPLVEELSLIGLEGGRFELVATLLNAEGKESDRKTARFTVSPRTSIVRPGVRGSIAPPRTEVPGVVAMVLGEQYLKIDATEKARTQLELAIRENPQLGPARELLAGLLLDGGDIDGVVSVLEPLARNAPDRFEVLAILGQAYFYQKQYAKSAELLEKAITLKRPEPRLLNILALAQHELGNDARAKEILERSLSLNPDQSSVKDLLEKLKAGTTGPR